MKENFTSIAVIMDMSGSMHSLASDTIGGYNAFLKEQQALPGEAELTLAFFSDTYKLVHDGLPIKQVPELTSTTYVPSGGTALLDAVGRTIDVMGKKFAAMPEEARPNKIVVVITSDGAENISTEYKLSQIKEMVSHQQEKYNWSFVFVGANIDSFAAGTSMGVKGGNTYSYTASSIGTKSLYSSISTATTNFRAAKAGAAFTMVNPIGNVDTKNKVDTTIEMPAITPTKDMNTNNLKSETK